MLLYQQRMSKIICLLMVFSQIFDSIKSDELNDFVAVNSDNAVLGDFGNEDDPTAIDASKAGDCTDDYQIKTLKLVLSWGPGICSTKVKCKDPTTDFTIHGFWPKFVDTTHDIRCCTRERYDKTVTHPLRQAMDNWWPPLNGMNFGEFWFYQWDKHGRCMSKISKINTVFNYFYFILYSFKEFRIKNALIEDGFEPDDEDTYLGSDIVESLKDTFGVKVELDCARLKSNHELRTLTEVTICFDKDLQPIDCPYSKSRCLKRILFQRSLM